MTGRRLSTSAVALFALVGVAQWWHGSPPLALLVASYVAVMALLTRWLPLRIAVAAGLLVQHGVWLACVLVLPLLLGGPLRPGIALAVLLIPCLAVVAQPGHDTVHASRLALLVACAG